MAATKRTTFEIESDRAEIARLYRRRHAQHEIAMLLNAPDAGRTYEVSRHMVQDDLEAIQKQWRADAARDFDAAKAAELARIDELERTYWRAWEASQRSKVVISEETGLPDAAPETPPDVDGEDQPKESTPQLLQITKVVKRTEGQVGNPAYLAGVQWCIDRRCKLLGLDAPAKHELTGKDGQPLPTSPTVLVYLPDNGRGPGDGRSSGD